ncbi:MAG TPA: hypothetical protein VGE43_12835, partial [Acidimicrobiales bacterium]
LVPVAIGVAVSGDSTPTREPAAYRGTDLADFDTSTAVVQRAPFCDLVPEAAVTKALGGAEATLAEYANGEQSDAFPNGDVAHEYGCRFSPADTDTDTDTASLAAPVEARGWVFAPPITANAAKALVAAPQAAGCTPIADAPAYGTPSTASYCPAEGSQTVSFRGLFGDAWLACSLALPSTVPQPEAVERAGRWCVAVAQAASVPLS